MYKTETHLHVKEVSGCGRLYADEMISRYADAGYTTVFVTDHCIVRFFEKFEDMLWNEKVDKFFSGYRNAKIAGEKYGVTILPGAELTFAGEKNHYLTYGITEEFMYAHPDLLQMGIKKFSEIAKENGIFIVQAHPYRDGSCTPAPEYVDAMEVYNSNPRHEDFSDQSEQTANENNLPKTAGSDAHRIEDVGLSGVMTENPITSVSEYIELVKKGKITLIR